MRSKKQEKKFEQLKVDINEALNDKNFRLFIFTAIGEEGVTKMIFGAERRSDFILMLGELNESIQDISKTLYKQETLQELAELMQQHEEEEPRVLNS